MDRYETCPLVDGYGVPNAVDARLLKVELLDHCLLVVDVGQPGLGLGE